MLLYMLATFADSGWSEFLQCLCSRYVAHCRPPPLVCTSWGINSHSAKHLLRPMSQPLEPYGKHPCSVEDLPSDPRGSRTGNSGSRSAPGATHVESHCTDSVSMAHEPHSDNQ